MIYFFLAAVCGINLYNWWKLRDAFLHQSLWGSALLLIAFLALAMMPVWIRVLFRGRGNAPDWLEQLAWVWLAWAFWLTSVFLALELWNLVTLSIWNFRVGRSAVSPTELKSLALSPAATVAVAVGAVLLATAWGIIEARAVNVKHLSVTSDKIPEHADGFRILLISDLHIGPALDQNRLQRIIRRAREASADLVLSAGDLVDGKAPREQDMARQLAEVTAAFGKIACVGNHDVYTGVDDARQLHQAAGFELLENSGTWATDWLWVAGPVDPAFYHRNAATPGGNAAADNLLPPTPMPENTFTILLKHRPDPEPESRPAFDLQLSGHTHGGQIFPFNLLVRLHHRWKTGHLYQLPTGTAFYISRGTGTWGPPFRLFAPPELTLITLKRP